MNIAEIKPYAVIKRFPEHRQTIEGLFKNNSSFRTLCSDYLRCSKALGFWAKSGQSEASYRSQEYEALLFELELEIVQIVQSQKN